MRQSHIQRMVYNLRCNSLRFRFKSRLNHDLASYQYFKVCDSESSKKIIRYQSIFDDQGVAFFKIFIYRYFYELTIELLMY